MPGRVNTQVPGQSVGVERFRLHDIEVFRVVPLWRMVAWGGLFVVVACVLAQVRFDVNALRMDISATSSATEQARLQNARLQLELEKRRGVFALESAAQDLNHLPAVVIQVPSVAGR
jgi:hypothetical protein